MSQEEFEKLFLNSPDYRQYVFYSLATVEAGVEKAIPLLNGNVVYSISIPNSLAHFIENPPTVDLESELIEPEEDCEASAI